MPNSERDGGVQAWIEASAGLATDRARCVDAVLPRQAPNAHIEWHGPGTTMKEATTTMKKSKSGSKEGKEGVSPYQLNVSPVTDDPIYWASVFRMIAVNFRLSAEAILPNLELRDDGPPAELAAIPFYFLVSQAIELFLKSALLKRGYVLADLKRFNNRHNLKALLKLLNEKGLRVSTEATSIIEGLSPQHSDHLLRYHFLINPFMPSPATLWPVLDMLTRISTHGR